MSNDKLFSLIEIVLKEWKGTPEELGHTLYTATMNVEPCAIGTWQEKHAKRMERLQERGDARRRIKECQGGAELILAEMESLKALGIHV